MLSANPSAIPMEQDPFQFCPIPSRKRSWSKMQSRVLSAGDRKDMRRGILCYRGSSYLPIMLLIRISASILEQWLNILLKGELIACVNSAGLLGWTHIYKPFTISKESRYSYEAFFDFFFHPSHPSKRCWISLQLLQWKQCPYPTRLTHVR